MATANRLKAASTRQRVCQRGRRAGKARGAHSTDEFILSADKGAARSSVSAITASGGKISRTLWIAFLHAIWSQLIPCRTASIGSGSQPASLFPERSGKKIKVGGRQVQLRRTAPPRNTASSFTSNSCAV